MPAMSRKMNVPYCILRMSTPRASLDEIQHSGKPHAGPFGDVGPALLAGVQQDVAFRRQASHQLCGRVSELLHAAPSCGAPVLFRYVVEQVRDIASLDVAEGSMHRERLPIAFRPSGLGNPT
jgi:hypothetical protein